MKNNKVYKMTAAALMAAMLCVLAPLSLPIGPVPISLATFVVYLMAYILGSRLGTVSVLLYLLIGLVGAPVFSGYSSGPAKLFGPTGGYLIGYLFLVYISGIFIEKFPHNKAIQIAGMVIATAVLYTIGTVYLAYSYDMTAQAALAAGVIPFLPGDAAKIILAFIAGPLIRKRLTRSNVMSYAM